MLQKHRIPLMSFQLTAVRRRLLAAIKLTRQFGLFQLTAARRRLRTTKKAAAPKTGGFNSQPPEGGCHQKWYVVASIIAFQLTAARRRLLRGD